MIEVETVFDNTTVGTNWYGAEELATANNIKRVIFDVKSVDISLSQPNRLACWDEIRLNCVLPIDSSLQHNWDISATNGVLEGDYVFYMNIYDETTNSLAHTSNAGPAQTLISGQRVDLAFTPWAGYQDGHTYNISYHAELDDGTPSENQDSSLLHLPKMLILQFYQTRLPELQQSSRILLSWASHTLSSQ